MNDLIDALAQRLCDQQYPPGYHEDSVVLPEGAWTDAIGTPSPRRVEFLEAWRDKARNVIALLSDAGYDVVKRPHGPDTPPTDGPARTVEVSDRTGQSDPDLP